MPSPSACGAPRFEKQVTAAGFQLKGSGWYVTDFRNPQAAPAAAKPEAGNAATDKAAEKASDGNAAAAPAADSKTPAGAPAATPAAAPTPAATPSPSGDAA